MHAMNNARHLHASHSARRRTAASAARVTQAQRPAHTHKDTITGSRSCRLPQAHVCIPMHGGHRLEEDWYSARRTSSRAAVWAHDTDCPGSHYRYVCRQQEHCPFGFLVPTLLSSIRPLWSVSSERTTSRQDTRHSLHQRAIACASAIASPYPESVGTRRLKQASGLRDACVHQPTC